MEPGHLIIVRRGAVYWDSLEAKLKTKAPHTIVENLPAVKEETLGETGLFVSQQQEQSQTSMLTVAPEVTATESFSNIINIKSLTHDLEGSPLNYKIYDIVHLTEYNYSVPVEHQGVAVGVHAARGESDDVITGAHPGAVD